MMCWDLAQHSTISVGSNINVCILILSRRRVECEERQTLCGNRVFLHIIPEYPGAYLRQRKIRIRDPCSRADSRARCLIERQRQRIGINAHLIKGNILRELIVSKFGFVQQYASAWSGKRVTMTNGNQRILAVISVNCELDASRHFTSCGAERADPVHLNHRASASTAAAHGLAHQQAFDVDSHITHPTRAMSRRPRRRKRFCSCPWR